MIRNFFNFDKLGRLVVVNVVDFSKLGCDFFTFSGHKVFGPMGIGVVLGKEDLLNNVNKFIISGGYKYSYIKSIQIKIPVKITLGDCLVWAACLCKLWYFRIR